MKPRMPGHPVERGVMQSCLGEDLDGVVEAVEAKTVE